MAGHMKETRRLLGMLVVLAAVLLAACGAPSEPRWTRHYLYCYQQGDAETIQEAMARPRPVAVVQREMATLDRYQIRLVSWKWLGTFETRQGDMIAVYQVTFDRPEGPNTTTWVFWLDADGKVRARN